MWILFCFFVAVMQLIPIFVMILAKSSHNKKGEANLIPKLKEMCLKSALLRIHMWGETFKMVEE